jgi:hypothetical protein
MSRCTTSFWMPRDSVTSRAVAGSDHQIEERRAEVTLFPETGRPLDAFVIEGRAEDRRPFEIDRANPVDEATTSLSVCASTPDGLGVVTLPGPQQRSSDPSKTSAKTLHDCLMQGEAKRAWVIDLRGGGGDTARTMDGLAPLLPAGRRAGRDAGKRTGPPLIVVFDALCGGSCERTANALAARPRTLLIGEPVTRHPGAWTPLLIDDAYVVSLASGYLRDPCGTRLTTDRSPDLAVDHVGTTSVGALLALPLVSDWLTRQRDHPSMSSTRCGAARQAASH